MHYQVIQWDETGYPGDATGTVAHEGYDYGEARRRASTLAKKNDCRVTVAQAPAETLLVTFWPDGTYEFAMDVAETLKAQIAAKSATHIGW